MVYYRGRCDVMESVRNYFARVRHHIDNRQSLFGHPPSFKL